MKLNYIYLLIEREFINAKLNIYKVGRTRQVNHNRLKQYPKSSMLLTQKVCIDRHKMERLIIAEFKKKFIQRKDVGREYFEGNYHEMIIIIEKIINNERDEYNKLLENEDSEYDSVSESDIPLEYKCELCEIVFQNEILLKNHNCKIKFICKKCKRKFTKKDDYKDHKNRKFPCVASQEDFDNGLACVRCNTRYSTDWNLRVHKRTCGKNININIYIKKRTL